MHNQSRFIVSKMTVAQLLVLFVCLINSANAHGHMKFNFNNNEDHRDTEAGVDLCGINGQVFSKYRTGITNAKIVTRGRPLEFGYQITNSDGAGPLDFTIDATGNGDAFNTPLTVAVNVPGEKGILNTPPNGGSFPFIANVSINIPQDLQCNGPSGVCLLRAKTATNFVSCFFILPQDSAPQVQTPQFGSAPGMYNSQYMYNPYNQFGMQSNQFGRPVNQFGGPQIQFGAQINQFGGPQPQFGSPQPQFRTQFSQFPPQQNQYRVQSNQFGNQMNQFSRQPSQVNVRYNQFGGQRSQFPNQQMQRGVPSNQFASQRTQFPNQNRQIGNQIDAQRQRLLSNRGRPGVQMSFGSRQFGQRPV